MMTLILLIALQQEGSSTMVTFRTADTYRLPADLASDDGDVSLTHLKSTGEVFHKVDSRNFLLISGTGEYFGYGWSDRAAGLPEDLHSLRLSAAAIHAFDQRWKAVVFASSAFHYEDGAAAEEGGTYAGGAGAAYQVAPELTLGALVGAFTRLEDGPAFFVVPYVEWKPFARWAIRTEMREGMGLEATHLLDDSGVWALQARGITSKRRFRLNGDSIRPDGIFEDSRFTVMAGGRWQPLHHLSISLILGVDLRQRYALEDGKGRGRTEFDTRPGLVLGFYFTGSF